MLNSKKTHINKENIQKNLEMISFPRLSGTEHEQKAADKLIQEIKGLNLTPCIQEFSFSSFYSRIYKKIAFSLIFWLVFVIFININLIFTLINVFFVIIVFIPLIIYTRKPENIHWGTKYHSKNIYLHLNSLKAESIENNLQKENPNTNENLQLLFLSHYDSKSQTFPIRLRVIALRSWIYTIILISIGLIIKFLFFDFIVIKIIIVILLFVNFISTIMIILNFSKNKSDGAIDNGSGVSITLELLKYYAQPQHRPEDIDLWFVFTGAEETGTMGIRFFKDILKEYEKDNVKFFNLDAIAQHLDIFGSTNLYNLDNNFFNLLFDLSEPLDSTITIKRYITAITRSDGYYLKKEGYLGLDFGDKESYKYIHTAKDTVDKINCGLLSEICELFIYFLDEV
jgi:hypothetical protein